MSPLNAIDSSWGGWRVIPNHLRGSNKSMLIREERMQLFGRNEMVKY